MPAGWISAGVAAVGAIQSISGNSGAQGATNSNNADSKQVTDATNTMLGKANDVSNQPFQAYTGQLTAGVDPNQQAAADQAARVAGAGTAQGLNTKANSLIDQVGGSNWNQGTIDKYMNPYTKNVTDAALAAENKSYLQNLSGLQTGEAGSGAFGGSRAAIGETNLAGAHNMNAGTLTATGNRDAYDSAMKAWQADNTTKLNAADAYNKSGQDVTRMNSTQISDLLKTGGARQVIAQTGLDAQYGQFMRQQNWQADQLNTLIKAVSTAKSGAMPSQVAPVQSNTANQLLGLASTLGGLYGSGSSGNSGTPTGNVTGNIAYTDPMAGMSGGAAPAMPAIA